MVLLAAGCNSQQQTMVETQSPVSANEATSSTDANTMMYTNTEFGFHLNLNKDWQGYKVTRDASQNTGNGGYVTLNFAVPTQDKNYPGYTDYIKEFGGYPVLALHVFTKANYETALKVPTNDPGPWQAVLKSPIGKSNAYVVVKGVGGNAPPPTDVKIDNDESIKVAKTLKFTK